MRIGGHHSHRTLILKTVLSAALLLTAGIAYTAPVKVEGGLLEGTVENGISVYKGIPFATPPVGDLRWRAPQPAPKWQGVRVADKFASPCVQGLGGGQGYPDLPAPSEDCLYLNIWSPAKNPSDRIPVLVWIHGGGFSAGSASERQFNGEKLAKKGVVYVSIAYRLGLLGFMAHPGLSAENERHVSGNYGLQDMIAALGWIQRNIAVFGGNPKQVTIFGESAGGIAVSMLSASPLAKGLFHGVISESGGSFGPADGGGRGPGEYMEPLASAERTGQAWATAAGASTVAEMRRIPAEKVVSPSRGSNGLPWPIVDGWVIPDDQYKLYEARRFNDTPVLVGYNSDEGLSFGAAASPEAYVQSVRQRYGIFADKLITLYPPGQGKVAKTARDLGRDTSFGWHQWVWARLQSKYGKSKAFLYYFDQHPDYPADSPRAGSGAPHGADVPYVFQYFDRPNQKPTAEDLAISEAMATYWTNFAKRGDPNGGGVPNWPAFSEAKPQAMYFAHTPHAGPVASEEGLKGLDSYFAWRRTDSPTTQSSGAATGFAQSTTKCTEMTKFKLTGVKLEITGAAWVPAGPLSQKGGPGGAVTLPAHCRVDGMIDRRTGAGGITYGIGFAVSLPENWNGRFLQQGGGGLNGTVAEPMGREGAGSQPALLRGFAVATTDTGHKAQSGGGFDSKFMQDQQALIDFEYAAIGRVAVIAKQIVEAYYAKPPAHSYFAGCSTGGREAMLMTQRYPLYFDGVIAGAPAMRTGLSNLADRTVSVALNRIAPKGADGKPVPGGALSDGDRKLIISSFLDACDGRDGIKDGMIFDPLGCKFDPASLVCNGPKAEGCLSEQQAAALKEGFAGPKDSRGNQVYPGFFFDTGIAATGGGIPGLIASGTGPMGPPNASTEQNIDAEAAAAQANPAARLGDSAYWTNLNTFSSHGGKLIFYHGVSDPWFSAKDTIGYYERMSEANGGQAQVKNWSRLFLSPGMGHCSGGSAALDSFDLLSALVDWVEKGTTPESVNATGRAFPSRSRPLCAFPTHAQYKGQGNPEEAVNFECK